MSGELVSFAHAAMQAWGYVFQHNLECLCGVQSPVATVTIRERLAVAMTTSPSTPSFRVQSPATSAHQARVRVQIYFYCSHQFTAYRATQEFRPRDILRWEHQIQLLHAGAWCWVSADPPFDVGTVWRFVTFYVPLWAWYANQPRTCACLHLLAAVPRRAVLCCAVRRACVCLVGWKPTTLGG